MTKQPDEKRNKRLNLRFTEAELSAVEEAAQASGISPTNYARQRVMATLKSRHDASVIRQLTAIGNNLNQIAKRINSGSEDDSLVTDVRQALAELSGTVKAISTREIRDDHGQNSPT